MKPITSTLILILLVVLGGCAFTHAGEKLPAEYADYKVIDEIKDIGNYTVEKFDIQPNSTVEHSINARTHNVIIAITTEIDDRTRLRTFYKLDRSGTVIDTYQFTRSLLIKDHTGDEEMVGGAFLVNKEKAYTTTWPLDGDTTQKPFIAVNKDLAWSAEKVDAFYKEVVKNSARLDDVVVWEKVSAQENKKRVSKVYYLNSTGKWYVLYGNSLTSDYSGKSLSTTNTLFENFTRDERFFRRYKPPGNISIPYFERQSYEKFCAADQVGCHTVYLWSGKGYYQVALNNGLLKFKSQGSLSHTDGKEFPAKESLLVDFAYYTNPNLNYSLFSANEALYLIKEK